MAFPQFTQHFFRLNASRTYTNGARKLDKVIIRALPRNTTEEQLWNWLKDFEPVKIKLSNLVSTSTITAVSHLHPTQAQRLLNAKAVFPYPETKVFRDNLPDDEYSPFRKNMYSTSPAAIFLNNPSNFPENQ